MSGRATVVSYAAEMLTPAQVVEVVRLAVRNATVTVEIHPMAWVGNAWTIRLDGLGIAELPAIEKAVTT